MRIIVECVIVGVRDASHAADIAADLADMGRKWGIDNVSVGCTREDDWMRINDYEAEDFMIDRILSI